MSTITTHILEVLTHPFFLVGAPLSLVVVALIARHRKMAMLVVRSLSRNRLRSALTSMAVMVLVIVITFVWTILYFLNQVTEEKSKDLKAIVTERWQIPSQMPFSYAAPLSEGAARRPTDARPTDAMTWSFYGGTLDPAKRTRENIVFFFVMDPRKLKSMMDDLDQLDDELVKKMLHNKRAVVMGRERMKAINKRVGERFQLTSLNYKDIDLEFEIIAELPDGRYNQSAVMNLEYLKDSLDAYARNHNGERHPMADKSLNLVWLKVADMEAFRQVADQLETSSQFTNPAVKCETASSGIASFLDAYRDLLWGMRWGLVPAVLVTMSLVIANAISISVRERRTEIAVLKVIGFRPRQVLMLVLAEAVLLGAGSGFVSTAGMYLLFNLVLGGVKFPIAFFPAFVIPGDAFWWGPVIGAGTALAGSIVPAWSAMRVKVSEVFSKVA
jgi:putative ABC transport system permease protein